jgi:hypothetical protein
MLAKELKEPFVQWHSTECQKKFIVEKRYFDSK